jgi:hypothetical protein
MDPEIKSLLQAVTDGRLQEELKSHKLTPQLGAAVRQVFDEALAAQRGGDAMAAAYLAASIYQALGDQTNRVANLFDFLQVRFMMAGTPPQYQAVREQAMSLVGLADDAKSPRFAFYASVLAADCAFFVTQGTNDSAAWIVTTLRDLNAVSERADGFQKDLNFVKFVDLLANVANMAMPRVFLDKDQADVDSLLKALAQRVDTLIPPDFEYPNNPQQTAKITAVLTDLTDRYAG